MGYVIEVFRANKAAHGRAQRSVRQMKVGWPYIKVESTV